MRATDQEFEISQNMTLQHGKPHRKHNNLTSVKVSWRCNSLDLTTKHLGPSTSTNEPNLFKDHKHTEKHTEWIRSAQKEHRGGTAVLQPNEPGRKAEHHSGHPRAILFNFLPGLCSSDTLTSSARLSCDHFYDYNQEKRTGSKSISPHSLICHINPWPVHIKMCREPEEKGSVFTCFQIMRGVGLMSLLHLLPSLFL